MIRRNTIESILDGEHTGREVTVYAWVKTARTGKSVAFAALNDGSSVNNLQAVFNRENFTPEQLSGLLTGACIRVTGTVVGSQGSEQSVEVAAERLEIIGPVDDAYPCRETPLAGVPSGPAPSAAQDQHLRRCFQGQSPPLHGGSLLL